MKSIVKGMVKKWIIPRVTSRDYNFNVKEGDTFIISYPRSGNTWMRFLLANLLLEEKEIDFNNVEEIIVDIYKSSDLEIVRKKYDYRIFKSHSFFRPKFSKGKVVYLVRDVRDVAISYFYYSKKTGGGFSDFDSFLTDFLEGELGNFGNWAENVGSWLGAKEGDEDFLLVKYEDMLEDTEGEVRRVSRFLGLESSTKQIKEAVQDSKFDSMKEKEQKNKKSAPEFRNTSEDIDFVRKGKTNQWKSFFSDQHIESIDNSFGHLLEKLGYK